MPAYVVASIQQHAMLITQHVTVAIGLGPKTQRCRDVQRSTGSVEAPALASGFVLKVFVHNSVT